MFWGLHVRWSALGETKAKEWIERFVYGGALAATVGWISHRFGSVVAGLLLAFPSILPASLTFAKRHGGREQAVDEARGAAAGSAGLAVFGLIVWMAPSTWRPPLVLALASLGWLCTSALGWRAFLG